jgi:hypothetical protein
MNLFTYFSRELRVRVEGGGYAYGSYELRWPLKPTESSTSIVAPLVQIVVGSPYGYSSGAGVRPGAGTGDNGAANCAQ